MRSGNQGQRAGTRPAQQRGIEAIGFEAMAAGIPSPAMPLSSSCDPGQATEPTEFQLSPL